MMLNHLIFSNWPIITIKCTQIHVAVAKTISLQYLAWSTLTLIYDGKMQSFSEHHQALESIQNQIRWVNLAKLVPIRIGRIHQVSLVPSEYVEREAAQIGNRCNLQFYLLINEYNKSINHNYTWTSYSEFLVKNR